MKKILVFQLLSVVATFGLLMTSGWLIVVCALTGASLLTVGGSVFVLSGPVRFFALLRPVVAYAGGWVAHQYGSHRLNEYRRQFYQLLSLMPATGLSRYTGSLALGRWANDLLALAARYECWLPVFRIGLITAVSATACLVVGAWLPALAVLLATAGAVAIVYSRLNGLEKLRLDAERANEVAYRLTLDLYRQREWLFLAGHTPHYTEKAGAATVDYEAARLRHLRKLGGLSTIVQAWMSLWFVGASVGLVTAYGRGLLSAPATVAVAVAALAYILEFGRLVAALDGWQAANASQRRLTAIPEAVETVQIHEQANAVADGAVIVGQGIGFTFPGAKRALLSGISLHLRPRQILIVTGENGCGKTTLLRLLSGEYAMQEGQLRVCGQDVRARTRVQATGLVPQSARIFTASVAENLRLADPAATDSKLVDGLERAGLGDWFARLPDGLETIVHGGDGGLSVGEKRRFELARVLLLDPPVILLDEPTEGLDEAAKRAMLEQLAKLAEIKSLVVVTHLPDILFSANSVKRLHMGHPS